MLMTALMISCVCPGQPRIVVFALGSLSGDSSSKFTEKVSRIHWCLYFGSSVNMMDKVHPDQQKQ